MMRKNLVKASIVGILAIVTLTIYQIGNPMEIKTEIIIKAPVEKVWEKLTDFAQYPNWNPFIIQVESNKIVGEQMLVTIKPIDKKPMSFKPKLLKFAASSELRWIGIVGARWIFSGEHYFILQPINNNETKLIHGENFSGILVPLFIKAEHIKKSFENMNDVLKESLEHAGVANAIR